MKIPPFRPAVEADFLKVQDKQVFEVIAPVQRTVKDLVLMSQKRIGTENLNEAVIQIDLIPEIDGTPLGWTTVEVSGITGPIKGGCLLIADYSSGLVSGWGFQIVNETQIKVRIRLDPDTGVTIPSSVTTRWVVKGS